MKPESSPASQPTRDVSQETNADPVAADHGETILEKGETALQEVNPNAERNILVGEIRAAIKAAGITMSAFAGKVREAGLVAPGVQVIDSDIESLREIAANVADIIAGQFIPLD